MGLCASLVHRPRIGHWDTRCRESDKDGARAKNEGEKETEERLAVTWRPGNRYDDVDLAVGPMRRRPHRLGYNSTIY